MTNKVDYFVETRRTLPPRLYRRTHLTTGGWRDEAWHPVNEVWERSELILRWQFLGSENTWVEVSARKAERVRKELVALYAERARRDALRAAEQAGGCDS